MDVDSVLLGVEERNKWRSRMELLQRSLREIREKRRKLELKLRRVKRELVKLAEVGETITNQLKVSASAGAASGAQEIRYPH